MSEETSLHVRRAKRGDRDSLGWLVERFTPLLLTQARYRLRARDRIHEPAELVNEVWLAALPVLPTLETRAGRETPVLLKFLATTLLYKSNEWARRELRRTPAADAPDPDSLPRETLGAVTRACRAEARGALEEALEGLGARDREVFVLRGIEQLANERVAELVGDSPNAVSLRYNRVLEKLRRALPGSLVDELDPGADENPEKA